MTLDHIRARLGPDRRVLVLVDEVRIWAGARSSHFCEFFGAARGSVYWNGVVEPREVDLVLTVLLLEGHEPFEPVTPENLAWKVGTSSLGGHARGLDDSLQDDDQLELLPVQVLGRHFVERTVCINFMYNDNRPHEKESVASLVEAQVDVELVERHHFSFFGDLLLDEHRPDVGLDDLRLAHVAHAEYKAELAVLLAQAGVFTEHQRLRPFLRSRQFGEHDSGHQRLADDPETRLEHHEDNGFGALLGGVSRTVADGVLRLDGEEQRGDERVDLLDARLPLLVVEVVEVAVGEAHEPPDHGEGEPAEREGEGEQHQVVAPLDVHEGGEDVGQVAAPALADVRLRDVHLAVLVHQPAPHAL